jgi:eukaryotic-like serine/threonine-protein kinase
VTPVDRERWGRIREQLAELLDLAPEDRDAWLQGADPESANELRELLAVAGASAERFERRLIADAGVLLAAIDLSPGSSVPSGADQEAPTLAGLRLGPWQLEHRLGRGGMAEVWQARRADGDFDQVVAVKLLKPGMDSAEIVRRFVRERQILARLDHPRIARLLDGGLAPDGRPYLVMEKVEGQPITDWCRDREVDLEGRVHLLLECCDAVAAAHRRLVVHRDLKPSNILVAQAGGKGSVKLLDFGIAKLLEDDAATNDATRSELRLLTPAYAAPEQILGEPVSTATDVYALGVLAYELLSGALPHRRPRGDLARAISSEVAERPSTAVLATVDAFLPAAPAGSSARRRWAKSLVGDLDTIVLTALRREPERRYPSIDALADDLRRFLGGRPIAARRESLGYRASKFVGRHRLAVTATALASLLLVGAFAAALLQARRAEREATRAERVRAFLVSIFEVSDPARSRGEQVTARALLDEGARRVESELAAEGELRSEMFDLLAGLYRKLGAFDEARALAERSLALRSASAGVDSVEAARSEWTLGWILVGQGEFTPARERLEHAIAVFDRVEGPDSLAAAEVREPLMELLFLSEGPQATLPVVERRLATYRRVLGEREERSARALSDLGVVQLTLGSFDEAERSFRASAAVLDEVLPAGDPRTAFPHSNLGYALLKLGRAAEGEIEVRKAIAIRTQALGPDHPETLVSQGQLNQILLALERYPEAEANARQSLALIEGKDRSGANQHRAALAQVLLESKQYPEALALFDATIAERHGLMKPDHILMLQAEVNRARALEGLGRNREALAALERVIPVLQAKGPEGARALEKALAARERLSGG